MSRKRTLVIETQGEPVKKATKTDPARNQIGVTVRLAPSIAAALNEAAKNQDTSKNRIINEALAKYLKIDPSIVIR